MITLYDHIQELRAELRGCYMTRRDRAGVQAELARAVAEQAELDRAFDSALEALQTAAETVGAARKRPPLPSPAPGLARRRRTDTRACAGRGAPRPGTFRCIGPRSGTQRPVTRLQVTGDRRTRGATRRAPSMASTIEDPPFDGR